MRDIKQSTMYNVTVVSHFIQNIYNDHLSQYGLTSSQAKVIYFLAKYGEQNQTELQNKLYIKASSMNGIVDTLQRNGLAEKRDSHTDKRAKTITLTEGGRQLDTKIWNVLENMEAIVTKGFSEEEQITIRNWLDKMQQNLQNEVKGKDLP